MQLKLLIIILFFSVTQKLYSQDMRINYNMTYKSDTLNSEKTTKKMVLLVQNGESKFLTEKQYKVDSLRSTGFRGFAMGDTDFFVAKNKQNIGTKYYYVLMDAYKLTEPIKLDWKIEKDVAEKYGYKCQKALLKYKGRDWEVWFTQDIPVQEGPYIFRGLPGLIMEMRDASHSYEFSFSGLKKDFHKTGFEHMDSKPMEISRNNLKKVLMDYYNDPFREMRTGNVKAKFKDEKGNDVEPDFREMTKNTQSFLKKNNNPIELSEAIKYP